MVKEAALSLVKKMGMELVRSEATLRARWLDELQINLILDVGANIGQYASEVRKHGYRGRIVSLEPVRSTFQALSENSGKDRNWLVKQVAAGAQPTKTIIHISANTTSSSLLAINNRHIAAAPGAAYVEAEEVKVVRLDSLIGAEISATDRVWLKLDVQGYEFSALEGATHLLPQVFGMECELSVVQLYDGSPLIGEALVRISNMGFRLVSLHRSFWDYNTKDALQYDGIFKRNKPI